MHRHLGRHLDWKYPMAVPRDHQGQMEPKKTPDPGLLFAGPQGPEHLDPTFTPQTGDHREMARVNKGLSAARRLPPSSAAEQSANGHTQTSNKFFQLESCNLFPPPSSFAEETWSENPRHACRDKPLDAVNLEAPTLSTMSDYKDPSHQWETKRKPPPEEATTTKRPRLGTNPEMDASLPATPPPSSTTHTSPSKLASSSPLSSPPVSSVHQPSSPTSATPQTPSTTTSDPNNNHANNHHSHHPSPPPPPSNIDPTILPAHWTCCACHHLQPLPHPSLPSVEPPSHSKFPLSRKPRSSTVNQTPTDNRSARCTSCRVRHCLRCPVYDAQGRAIYTFGGQNLRADRLVPVGWGCCGCGKRHFGMRRYRSDLVVWIGGVVGVVVGCECEGGGRHGVCKECEVVNRYGERLGSLDAGSFILWRDPGSCLRENFLWWNEERKFLVGERGRVVEGRKGGEGVTWREEDTEMERGIKVAEESFEAAREEVVRVKKWILEFWEAIGKQERATKMRREVEETAATAAKRLAEQVDKNGDERNGNEDSGLGGSLMGAEREASR